MIEKLRQLREFSAEYEQIKHLKSIYVKEQKYEKAADMRDEERGVLFKIENILEIYESNFDSSEVFNSVKRDMLDVIKYIEDDDTSLTPALIRKLEADAKKAKEESSHFKKIIKEMSWRSITDPRPELIDEFDIDGAKCLSSGDLVIMYEREDGDIDLCIGRYAKEIIGVHDARYYFITKNPKDEPITINRIKGWQYIKQEEIRWIPIPKDNGGA